MNEKLEAMLRAKGYDITALGEVERRYGSIIEEEDMKWYDIEPFEGVEYRRGCAMTLAYLPGHPDAQHINVYCGNQKYSVYRPRNYKRA